MGVRAPLALPNGPNERWSLDFVSDCFTDGRRFRILAIVDDFTRESLTLIPDTSLSGARVARELDALIARYRAGHAAANAFVESFIGRLRDECLNETLFASLPQARAVLEACRIDDNAVRPHSALGNKTPQEFRAHHIAVAANACSGQVVCPRQTPSFGTRVFRCDSSGWTEDRPR